MTTYTKTYNKINVSIKIIFSQNKKTRENTRQWLTRKEQEPDFEQQQMKAALEVNNLNHHVFVTSKTPTKKKHNCKKCLFLTAERTADTDLARICVHTLRIIWSMQQV